MSDSILYLGIVVIWAAFLIPAFVRRPHTSRSERDAEIAEYDAGTGEAEVFGTAHDVAFASAVTDFEADVRVDELGEHSEYRYDLHMRGYGAAGPHPGPVPRSHPEPAAGPLPERVPGSHPGWGPAAGQPASGPSQSRQQMMRARRRILTILTSLVFITAAFVAGGYVKWWICVPPVGVLVLYVLLLREIAMADAEMARKRAAWEARAARDVWRRAHQAWEAEREAAAQPTAQVIDISSRVGDQLYDQYADAPARAVGD